MRMRMGLHKGEQGMQVQFRVSEHLAFCIPFLGGFSLNLFFFRIRLVGWDEARAFCMDIL